VPLRDTDWGTKISKEMAAPVFNQYPGLGPGLGPPHRFCELISDFGLTQLVSAPTHKKGNILDLILTDTPEIFSDVKVLPFMFDSDHFPIVARINLRLSRSSGSRRSVLDYKNADYNGLSEYLGNRVGINSDFTRKHANTDVEDKWGDWVSILNEGINSFIPKRLVSDTHRPKWIDADVKHLSNRVKSARRKANRNNRASSWSKFKTLRNQLRNLTRDKYRSHVNALGEEVKTNPKKLWSFYHSKTKSNSIPDTVRLNEQSASDGMAKAELFNQHFYSVFSHQPPTVLPEISIFKNENLECLSFTAELVEKVLDKLDVSKASGPDGISPRILKSCAKVLSASLAFIFTASMKTGVVPKCWKDANVVPIFKKKDKESVENYRGVSLLSTVSKVMERCVHNLIYPLLESMISPAQHGFVKGRSTGTQLVQFLDKIGSTLDAGGQTDVIYLIFPKLSIPCLITFCYIKCSLLVLMAGSYSGSTLT
jgi:hypothetical protein